MNIVAIKALLDIKYQKSHLEISSILAREGQLKSEIERLRALSFDTQSYSADKPEMQNIGADVIWMSWASNMIKRLNIELSQVLAQKEVLQKAHRKVFGQQCAVDYLFELAQKQKKQKNASKDLSALVEVTTYMHQTTLGPGSKTRK